MRNAQIPKMAFGVWQQSTRGRFQLEQATVKDLIIHRWLPKGVQGTFLCEEALWSLWKLGCLETTLPYCVRVNSHIPKANVLLNITSNGNYNILTNFHTFGLKCCVCWRVLITAALCVNLWVGRRGGGGWGGLWHAVVHSKLLHLYGDTPATK